jgi:riboflavin synthase
VLPFVVLKGSIAIDGISLTVAALSGHRLGIQVVPFTQAHTSLMELADGDMLNLETDVIGKYVARLLTHPLASPSTPQS